MDVLTGGSVLDSWQGKLFSVRKKWFTNGTRSSVATKTSKIRTPQKPKGNNATAPNADGMNYSCQYSTRMGLVNCSGPDRLVRVKCAAQCSYSASLYSSSSSSSSSGSFDGKCVCTTHSNKRILKFCPVSLDGDCGFSALAKAVNEVRWAQDPKHIELTAVDIREILRREVITNKSFYLEQAKQNEAFLWCLEENGGIDGFSESVVRSGMKGHWLGEKWGGMELLALSKALEITIEMFTYSADLRSIVSYERLCGGTKAYAGLLFTGPATGGHFDLLMETEDSKSSY